MFSREAAFVVSFVIGFVVGLVAGLITGWVTSDAFSSFAVGSAVAVTVFELLMGSQT